MKSFEGESFLPVLQPSQIGSFKIELMQRERLKGKELSGISNSSSDWLYQLDQDPEGVSLALPDLE